MLKFNDPWKELRKDLYGNTEPNIELEAITVPFVFENGLMVPTNRDWIDEQGIEMLPAIAASTSYGRREKIDNIESARKLNKKLIEKNHLTPFESLQFNFYIEGISKACGAQLSRYRSGNGHVSASRRFKDAKPRFVYPVLDYINSEDDAEGVYGIISSVNEHCFDYYEELRKGKSFLNSPIIHKEDARMVLPVSYATERSWFVNARELRYILEQRLASDAEWEIRRLATMIYNLVCPLLPSVFEDIGEKYIDNKQ